MNAILPAIISGVVSIIVALIAMNTNNERILNEIKTHNAVQDEKINNLTNEVKKHNNLIERTYALEKDVAVLKAKEN